MYLKQTKYPLIHFNYSFQVFKLKNNTSANNWNYFLKKSKEKLIFYECKIQIVKNKIAYRAKLRPTAP